MGEINLNDFEEFMVADYAPLNKPYVLTIVGASTALGFNQKTNLEEPVPVLHFKETPKKLKLTSRRNRKALARLFGPLSNNWAGKQITIQVAERKVFGELTRLFEIIGGAPAAAKQPQEAPKHAEAAAVESGQQAQPALLGR